MVEVNAEFTTTGSNLPVLDHNQISFPAEQRSFFQLGQHHPAKVTQLLTSEIICFTFTFSRYLRTRKNP